MKCITRGGIGPPVSPVYVVSDTGKPSACAIINKFCVTAKLGVAALSSASPPAASDRTLKERRLLLRLGTIADATIIAAPSSTRNASATRDPEMKQTRKDRNWHFGMKLHIGADKRGIVDTVRASDAAAADISSCPALLQERKVFGEQVLEGSRPAGV